MGISPWEKRILQDITIFKSGACNTVSCVMTCNFEKGHYGEHSCKVIRNLDQWSEDVVKRHFLSRVLAAPLIREPEPFMQFGRRYHEERFCEIILNLDQWFRR